MTISICTKCFAEKGSSKMEPWLERDIEEVFKKDGLKACLYIPAERERIEHWEEGTVTELRQ